MVLTLFWPGLLAGERPSCLHLRALTPISLGGSLPRTLLQFSPLRAHVPSQLLLNHPPAPMQEHCSTSRPGPRGEGPQEDPSQAPSGLLKKAKQEQGSEEFLHWRIPAFSYSIYHLAHFTFQALGKRSIVLIIKAGFFFSSAGLCSLRSFQSNTKKLTLF